MAIWPFSWFMKPKPQSTKQKPKNLVSYFTKKGSYGTRLTDVQILLTKLLAKQYSEKKQMEITIEIEETLKNESVNTNVKYLDNKGDAFPIIINERSIVEFLEEYINVVESHGYINEINVVAQILDFMQRGLVEKEPFYKKHPTAIFKLSFIIILPSENSPRKYQPVIVLKSGYSVNGTTIHNSNLTHHFIKSKTPPQKQLPKPSGDKNDGDPPETVK